MSAASGAGLDTVGRAVAQLAAGGAVVVVDDEDRENEGDLVIAAATATPELVAFMVRHTSGVLCVPMPGEELDRLGLPPMTALNEDPKGTAYTVSVDARTGVTTGISAADRARTVRVLADPASGRADLTVPGHVFPLRAVPGGVLRRAGHTEAAVDLCRLAGLPPVGVIAEIAEDDGTMARLPRLRVFAREHGLPIISIADLAAHRRRTEPLVERAVTTLLPTRHGAFRAVGFTAPHDDTEHVALVGGDLGDGRDVLVRLHSECLTGDAFGSTRCDCGAQLDASMDRVAREGGVIVYVRGHEGRGIGLLDKLRAYAVQDAGADTVEANLALGLPVDARDYAAAADVLRDLGVRSVRLLTNNPAKVAALLAAGLQVTERVPLHVDPTPASLTYLETKRRRMGHHLPDRSGVQGVAATPGRSAS